MARRAGGARRGDWVCMGDRAGPFRRKAVWVGAGRRGSEWRSRSASKGERTGRAVGGEVWLEGDGEGGGMRGWMAEVRSLMEGVGSRDEAGEARALGRLSAASGTG